MTYQPGMEEIESDIMERVLAGRDLFDPDSFDLSDVRGALTRDRLGVRDFGALLSTAADGLLEEMAIRAKAETGRYFGNTVRLFAPLYIANHCVNHCIYCAFGSQNKMLRGKLTMDEIESELAAISETGLDDVLILTGEARGASGVEYIGQAVKLASEHFGSVGIEIYPLNTDEYEYMRECGADFVSIYQETYDLDVYDRVHPHGPKRCFPYRFHSQERAARGGLRGMSFGVLLGLGDALRDSYATGLHAFLLQKKYPHIEVSFSVPRIRDFETVALVDASSVTEAFVGERKLLQIMLAYRLFMPYAGVTISTREREGFRNNVLGICATKISAGVSVGVGGYEAEQKGGEQFVISDTRSVPDVHNAIRSQGLQPVYTDYIRI